MGRKQAGLEICGVVAAMLLPRDEQDRPRWDDFEDNARFLIRAGISGLCVNGATGEYSGATAAERKEAVTRARRIAMGDGLVLCGIGGSRLAEVLAFARDAEGAGADGALVPAPHFFKYAQDDLVEFYRSVAVEVHLPILIYNLPAFTGGLDAHPAAELICGVDGIAGVKDSSGELELLSLLSQPKAKGALRLVGNDTVLAAALERGLCDGAVSGVAGVLPELTLAVWRLAAAGEWDRFHDLAAKQDALLRRLDDFPAPWGLKLVAELREIAPASPAIPLSAGRRKQAEEFAVWFREWWTSAADELQGSLCEPRCSR